MPEQISLNSLKGVIYGIISGSSIGLIKGDTRRLDYSSNAFAPGVHIVHILST